MDTSYTTDTSYNPDEGHKVMDTSYTTDTSCNPDEGAKSESIVLPIMHSRNAGEVGSSL